MYHTYILIFLSVFIADSSASIFRAIINKYYLKITAMII